MSLTPFIYNDALFNIITYVVYWRKITGSICSLFTFNSDWLNLRLVNSQFLHGAMCKLKLYGGDLYNLIENLVLGGELASSPSKIDVYHRYYTSFFDFSMCEPSMAHYFTRESRFAHKSSFIIPPLFWNITKYKLCIKSINTMCEKNPSYIHKFIADVKTQNGVLFGDQIMINGHIYTEEELGNKTGELTDDYGNAFELIC